MILSKYWKSVFSNRRLKAKKLESFCQKKQCPFKKICCKIALEKNHKKLHEAVGWK